MTFVFSTGNVMFDSKEGRPTQVWEKSVNIMMFIFNMRKKSVTWNQLDWGWRVSVHLVDDVVFQAGCLCMHGAPS